MLNRPGSSANPLSPVLTRVLVIDPALLSAKLVAEIVKGLGGRAINIAADEKQGMAFCTQWEPTLIFVESAGPRLDGAAFTRSLRRSRLVCRKSPVIMVTSDATAGTIKAARDSGVHEFLRKPFASGDLIKRVQAVATKPRNWIEAVGYVGPDRRRFNSAEYAGLRKREADSAKDAAAEMRDQSFRILAAALDQFDSDPAQAQRAIAQQADNLKDMASRGGEAQLAVAVAGLKSALASGPSTRSGLEGPVNAVMAFHAIEPAMARAS